MHAKYQCSIIHTSKDMSQVKVFVTDGQTDERTDGWMSFNVPCFRERRGTIRGMELCTDKEKQTDDPNNTRPCWTFRLGHKNIFEQNNIISNLSCLSLLLTTTFDIYLKWSLPMSTLSIHNGIMKFSKYYDHFLFRKNEMYIIYSFCDISVIS